MVLLTNPQTADLQQRIQNSSFGSPNYLQGFTGTMPGYQQNLLANNFQPGLITRDFSGGATSMNPSGVPNYLSYTPGLPPQYTETGFQLPYQNMVNAAVRQGGGSNASDANQAARDLAMQDRYTRNDDGSITQYDASTKKTSIYDLDDDGLSFAQKFFGNVTNVPTVSSLLEDAYDGVKNYFNPNKGPIGGEVTAQDFNAATGGSKPGSLGSYDRTKDTAFGDGNKPTGLNKSFTPDPKVTKEVNLSLNKTADPLSLPAGRFKGNDRPSRGVRSEGVAGGGNKDKGSAGGSVNTGGGGFKGRW